jgi:hypothetical protein
MIIAKIRKGKMNTEQFSISERMGTKKQEMNSTKKQLSEVCNDVFTTEEQQDTSYSTQKLTDLFLDLERDGITAIGFSLLIDLVNERAVSN